MDWDLWFEVEEEVGDEKYAKPTAYLSARFMDALGDATIRKWNRENGGRAVTEACCDCRYWHDPEWGDDLGMCRRYPPTVPCMEGGGIVEEHGITMTDHPLVLWDGWCGEWKERE